MLLGADCGHQLVLGKRAFDGEAAWNTELGWVLSGPQQTSKSSPRTTVAYLSSKVEALWQLEEPVDTKLEETMQPAFPWHCDEDGYTVGLLWKGTQRPEDNRKQTFATAKALARKLEAPEKRQAYDDVLVHVYQELGAVEEPPLPPPPQRSQVNTCCTMPLSVKEHKQRTPVSFSTRRQQLEVQDL